MYKYKYLGKHGVNLPHGITVKQYNCGDIIDTEVPIEELGFSPVEFELINKRDFPRTISSQIDAVNSLISLAKKQIENKTNEMMRFIHESRQMMQGYEKRKKDLETELRSLNNPKPVPKIKKEEKNERS